MRLVIINICIRPLKESQNKLKLLIIRRVIMEKEKNTEVYNKAKEMMIKGEDWDKIMEETRLRLKDLRRIQREEIDPHF